MSDPLRIALVVEGPTDFIVLRAAIRSLLQEREDTMRVAWPRVRARCSEAERFSIDLLALAQGA